MAPENDDGSRRQDYAELEAEMNAMTMPERTPEIEAHFQRVFAASHDPCISMGDGAKQSLLSHRQETVASRSLRRWTDPAAIARVPTVEPSKK